MSDDERVAGGSSPRMRGAPRRELVEPVCLRIIPADAGSTLLFGQSDGWAEDHPRGCGEHLTAGVVGVVFSGSSPRMRGARDLPWAFRWWPGIIPADAGSTPCWAARSRPCTDHPRGCGEHRKYPELTALVSGSSPRMRGAPMGHQKEKPTGGIIPADARSTSAWI